MDRNCGAPVYHWGYHSEDAKELFIFMESQVLAKVIEGEHLLHPIPTIPYILMEDVGIFGDELGTGHLKNISNSNKIYLTNVEKYVICRCLTVSRKFEEDWIDKEFLLSARDGHIIHLNNEEFRIVHPERVLGEVK